MPPAGQRLADGRRTTLPHSAPPSLPPSTASRRVSSSSASSSISSAVATSPSNGEQADSGRDYMATDGECSKEFIPSSSLIGNIFGNIDYACVAVNLVICPCARACGLRASLRPSKSPNGRQTRRWRAIAEDPRAAWGAHLQWIGKGRPAAAASDSTALPAPHPTGVGEPGGK